MDPEPERSVEPIDDDCSKPSYHSEQLLSEASDVSLPSRRRHWMDTRLRTRLRAGGTRQHYQQFDYSTSETDDETSDAMLPIPTHSPQLVQTQPADVIEAPAVPALSSDPSMFDCPPQLFSDHEPRRSPSPQLSPSDDPPELSPSGTSAPLLTHPSRISNYFLCPNHAKDTSAPTSRPLTPSADQAPPPLPKPPPLLLLKRGGGDLGKRQGRLGHPVHVNLRQRQRPRSTHQFQTLKRDPKIDTN